jgi:hypothetical protein
MHATFIYKWSFWDGFLTPSRLLFPKKICEWLPTIISALLSYYTKSHSMLNYTCPWGNLPFSHDQALKWSGKNIVSTHKSRFMPSISWCLNNTFLLVAIQSNNQGSMWSDNSRHHAHHEPSPGLGCFSIGCGKCLQLSVKKCHILKFSCCKWGHHTTYPCCSCILCIWISLVF